MVGVKRSTVTTAFMSVPDRIVSVGYDGRIHFLYGGFYEIVSSNTASGHIKYVRALLAAPSIGKKIALICSIYFI